MRVSEELGLGVEYGLNQQWVLAFDVVQNYADGTHLTGANAAGNFVSTHSASSVSFALAPAVEYNFTSNVGLITGVAFSAAGRNTSSYIAPQIALTIASDAILGRPERCNVGRHDLYATR